MVVVLPHCLHHRAKTRFTAQERGESFVAVLLIAAVFAAACLFLVALLEPHFVPDKNRQGPFSNAAFRFTGSLPSAGQFQYLLNAPSHSAQGVALLPNFESEEGKRP